MRAALPGGLGKQRGQSERWHDADHTTAGGGGEHRALQALERHVSLGHDVVELVGAPAAEPP